MIACGPHRLWVGDSRRLARTLAAEYPLDAMLVDPPWNLWRSENLAAVLPDITPRLVMTDNIHLSHAMRQFGVPDWIYVWDCKSSLFNAARPLMRAKFALWYGDLESYQRRCIRFPGREYRHWWGECLTDVFEWPRTRDKTHHRHEKPLEWIALLFAEAFHAAQAILDPFLGSGVALIAAEMKPDHEKRVFGIDRDAARIAAAADRYHAWRATLASARL